MVQVTGNSNKIQRTGNDPVGSITLEAGLSRQVSVNDPVGSITLEAGLSRQVSVNDPVGSITLEAGLSRQLSVLIHDTCVLTVLV